MNAPDGLPDLDEVRNALVSFARRTGTESVELAEAGLLLSPLSGAQAAVAEALKEWDTDNEALGQSAANTAPASRWTRILPGSTPGSPAWPRDPARKHR